MSLRESLRLGITNLTMTSVGTVVPFGNRKIADFEGNLADFGRRAPAQSGMANNGKRGSTSVVAAGASCPMVEPSVTARHRRRPIHAGGNGNTRPPTAEGARRQLLQL